MSDLRPRNAFRRPVELLLYGVSPAATLITAPLLARGLGPAARGEYGVATAVSTFALTLGAWGQAEVYLGEARGGRLGYKAAARIAAVGGILVAVLAAIALIGLGLPPLTAIATAIWLPLLTQGNIWRSVSIAAGDLKAPAINNALGPVFRIAVFTGLTFTPLFTTNTAILTMQLALTVALLLTMRRTAVQTRYWREPSKSAAELLRGGGVVIAFSILNAVMLRSDIIVLQLFAPAHEVGIYAAPASLTTAALALSTAFKSRIQSAALHRQKISDLSREALPVLALGLIGATALWYLSPVLVSAFFGSQYADSIPILRLLGFAAVPLLLADLGQGALVVMAKRGALLFAGVAGASAVIISLFIFVPLLGALGAAIACIIGYGIAAITSWTVLAIIVRRADAS